MIGWLFAGLFFVCCLLLLMVNGYLMEALDEASMRIDELTSKKENKT